MTMDSEKWAERIVRSPKTGRDYTSARVQDKQVYPDQTTRPSPKTNDVSDKFQNLDIRVDQLRVSTNNLDDRIEQLESQYLNERLIKTERRSQYLGILTIVLAMLLALSILRDVLVVTGTDVTSVVSNFYTNQPKDNTEVQPGSMNSDDKNGVRPRGEVDRIVREP